MVSLFGSSYESELALKNYLANHGINTPPFSLKGLHTLVRIVSIYDGDTVKAIIPMFGTCFKFDLRLNGIDTCEIRTTDTEIKVLAEKARDRLFELITNTKAENLTKNKIESYLDKHPCIIRIECLDNDKYGRILADLYIENEQRSLSQVLIEESLGYPYNGGRKTPQPKVIE